jgi:glyoxylase-like metal-dependent hydrolase (beta-lactamase superfamily II)
LQRVRELARARVYPGHGPIIEDPASVIEAYIRHRADRDRQILSVLGEGALPADAITARIYKGLPPELEKAAGETILAHLIKLESDGRVVQDEGRWTRGA